MPGFIKQTFVVLVMVLLGFFGLLAIKCASMNNQACLVRPTLINSNPDKLHYYPFIIILDRCDGSFNTVEYPFGRLCVPNKIEDMNLKVFDMIKGKNEPKQMKHISCECRCEFDLGKCNSKQKWNNDKCK